MDRMHTTISSSLVAGLAQLSSLSSASVARVWRYRNLFITITIISSLDQRCYCTSGLPGAMDGWLTVVERVNYLGAEPDTQSTQPEPFLRW